MSGIFKLFAREPLLHFLIAGLVLYGAYITFRDPGSADSAETIRIDRDDLLTFLQYQANAFDAKTFEAVLDGMSEHEIATLVDAYVHDEILYREAVALGLMDDDYVIRQRMIQKADFLFTDFSAATAEADDAGLADYFAAHRGDYTVEGTLTFTHVFFDRERRGAAAARRDAARAAEELNRRGAAFNEATGISDRFVYLKNRTICGRDLRKRNACSSNAFAPDIAWS